MIVLFLKMWKLYIKKIIFFNLILIIPILSIGQQDKNDLTLKSYVSPSSFVNEEWTDEKLTHFLEELTEFVIDNHVVKDSTRVVYGMTYEFWKDGKQMQTFSLDAMHDGLWFIRAMLTAYRATKNNKYLKHIQKFQVPFYNNVIQNSDVLFPGQLKIKSNEDNRLITSPVKGWVPRGWDDGFGTDRGSGKLFSENFEHFKNEETSFFYSEDNSLLYTYYTPSNHLAQDLAILLMDLWLTTRDPKLIKSITDIYNYRLEYFGEIPIIEFAKNFVDNKYKSEHKIVPLFSPDLMNPYYTGMYQQKGNSQGSLTSYEDALAWSYLVGITKASVEREFSKDIVSYITNKAYGHSSSMEMYFDNDVYKYGMYFFDLQKQPTFIEGKGKLDMYLSDGIKIFGARGIQISMVIAGILPALKKNPEIWENYYKENFYGEPLVRFVDSPPVIDGVRDSIYNKSQTIEHNNSNVTFLSDPKNLNILIESDVTNFKLEIQYADNVSGEKVKSFLSITNNGKIDLINDKGETLKYIGKFKEGNNWLTEISIPYTVVPGQNHWINGVENGRYRIVINDEEESVIYLLSDSNDIINRLERIVLGTIQTWHEVWKNKAIIPSGLYTLTHVENLEGNWEISDAGNYAALIQTIALWKLYIKGSSEWEAIKEQIPQNPYFSEPLPDGIIKKMRLMNE